MAAQPHPFVRSLVAVLALLALVLAMDTLLSCRTCFGTGGDGGRLMAVPLAERGGVPDRGDCWYWWCLSCEDGLE